MFDSHERSLYLYIFSLIGIALFAPTAAWVWIVTMAFVAGLCLPSAGTATHMPMQNATQKTYRFGILVLAGATVTLLTLLPGLPGTFPTLVPQDVQSPYLFHAFSGIEWAAALLVLWAQILIGSWDKEVGSTPFLSRIKGSMGIVFFSTIAASISRATYSLRQPDPQEAVAQWVFTFLFFASVCFGLLFVLRIGLRRK